MCVIVKILMLENWNSTNLLIYDTCC